MSSLSPRQITALKMLSYKGASGETVYGLGVVQMRTLESLLRRGLVQYHPEVGDMFFPKQRRFSITAQGFALLEDSSE